MAGWTLPKWAVAQSRELFGYGVLTYAGFCACKPDASRLPDGIYQMLEAVERCRRETPGAESLETYVSALAIFVEESERRYSITDVEYFLGGTSAKIEAHSVLEHMPHSFLAERVRAACEAA